MTESSSSLNAAQLLNHNNLLESPRQQQQQQRTRFNSRDIPRSYAGQYSHAGGTDNDLLPLECLRSHQFFVSKVSFAVFLSTYMTLVLAIQFCATLLLATTTTTTTAAATETTTTAAAYYLSSTFLLGSWTVTNVVHCIVTLMYLHWSKGSYLLDEQGELNAMTVWEQLEATHESTTHMRRTLLLVPTVLTYAACVTSHFEIVACLINVLTWSVSMLAKSPIMNGVRLFGINRTAGIDDDDNNTNNNNNYYDDSTMIDAVVKKLE